VKLADLNIVAEIGSMGGIREAVRAGGGASFVSQISIATDVQAATSRLARVPELGVIARTYYTVASRKRVLTPLARAFLDYLRQVAASPRPAKLRVARPAAKTSRGRKARRSSTSKETAG
jgi:DNA-binding transcriptional LysR family regulator